jgi:hypothetical protein
MVFPWVDIPAWEAPDVKAQSRKICGFVGVQDCPFSAGMAII